MAAGHSTQLVIYAALAGNVLVALCKFGAAAWTGSSAMLSEAIHSLVDTLNQILMLYGIHRAKAPPDEQHPLGHGRELYFWSFIVAVLIFGLGAGLSFYEGVGHILHPVPVTDPVVNYIVLGLSLLFEGISWSVALRAFNRQRGELGILEAASRSRDPASFLVLFEDTAAMIGILLALAGTFAAERLQLPMLDGVASLGIAAVLALTGGFLARESKGLLIGEPARERVRHSILAIASAEPGVASAGNLLTVHLAPQQIVVALDVDFADDLRASEVETIAGRIEQTIRAQHPEVVRLSVSPRNTAAELALTKCSATSIARL
jgi:cation diffusion facilitator family transporter